jgi:hypothetical protein
MHDASARGNKQRNDKRANGASMTVVKRIGSEN